jgi:hypothetical protein
MDEKGFREYLKDPTQVRKTPDEATADAYIGLVEEFEGFLQNRDGGKDVGSADDGDIRAFVAHLSKDGRNTLQVLIGLYRYLRFVGNAEAEVSLLLILDGAEILNIMCRTVKEMHGEEKAGQLLSGFNPPRVGTPPEMMPEAAEEFIRRLEEGIGGEATREVLLTGPHAAPPEFHVKEREMFLASEDIDEYRRKRHEEFVKELRGHMENDTYFFTQKIDQSVMDFVEGDQEISSGLRIGDKIFVTKIPFMAIEYLREEDEKMKRYYGCHCPLARESILSGKQMSRNLCYCSAGYDKRPFDVAFDRPLKAEVDRSILWGDTVCRFAIEVPKDLLPEHERPTE